MESNRRHLHVLSDTRQLIVYFYSVHSDREVIATNYFRMVSLLILIGSSGLSPGAVLTLPMTSTIS